MRQHLLLGLTVLAAAGCVGSGEEETFSCDRGFRSGDWVDQRLKTGQSIAKCDWLNGWSERRARRVLGAASGGSARNGIRYVLDDSFEGIGPLHWILTVKLEFETRRVIGVSTHTEPY